MINYTLTYRGSSQEALIHNAEMDAIHRTVGEFLFTDRILIAREILDAYLERNSAQFIAGVTVLDRVVDQRGYRLRMDVGVLAQQIERRLEEFRFLLTPRPTPVCFIFLQETLDDARQEVPAAKPLVAEALTDAGLQVSQVAILSPDSRIDVAEGGTDPTTTPTLAEAITNAQRGGVELLFTGQSTTSLRSHPSLYYDEHYFYDSSLLLRMFRTDTGELLGEVIVRDYGAHPDSAQAREIVLRKCASRAVTELMAIYHDRWPHEVHNEGDYHLMIHDIGNDDLDLLQGKLTELPGGARVFRHSLYHGIATLNVLYRSPFTTSETEERQGVVQFLRDIPNPQLRIESVDGRRIVARVIQVPAR
jgi:hypothetical protein